MGKPVTNEEIEKTKEEGNQKYIEETEEKRKKRREENEKRREGERGNKCRKQDIEKKKEWNGWRKKGAGRGNKRVGIGGKWIRKEGRR